MKLLLLSVLAFFSTANSAPQLISFKEGRLGVNFGGYHAGVGLGGLLGGGTAGGLYAEAGTPHGQAARAGLGGAVDAGGHSSGGLYAGATAGGNVKASAGLAGGVGATKTAGTGYAEAQAGDHAASSGLGGESSVGGSSSFSFSGTKSFGLNTGVIKEVEYVQPVEQVVVQPVEQVYVQPVQRVEVVKPVQKSVHTEVNVDTSNEVVPLIQKEIKVDLRNNVAAQVQPAVTVVKEVSRSKRRPGPYNVDYAFYDPIYLQHMFRPQFYHPRRSYLKYRRPENYYATKDESQVYAPPPVYEKRITHVHRVKPHHFHKSAYFGGYVGAPPPPPALVYHTVQAPVLQKRIDVDSSANVGVEAVGGGQLGYTKTVTYQRNPNFFADIFNIPIQTLKAVGNFLGNTAGSTNISVQKTASVQADADTISSKHAPVSSSSSVSSTDTKLLIETPSASKVIDDIFAIPINTLGAVNKFLENNVSSRKRVQVTAGEDVPTRVRLGPHARRRANKHSVVVLQETPEQKETSHEN